MIKKIKTFFVIISIVFLGSIGVYVIAQTVVDSFDDSSKIIYPWGISTSTSGEIRLATEYATSSCNNLEFYCSASTICSNSLGDGSHLAVARSDPSSTKYAKTSNTSCDTPQCGVDGGQSDDNLVTSNTIDFTDYPARDYCKSIGGRLPSTDELVCIYNNKASFGNNFVSSWYWSSTEYDTTHFRVISLSNGSYGYAYKYYYYNVRCVMGF